MAAAHEFKGFTASVFQSQDAEVTLAKQAVLSEHGREVRLGLSQMPPEVTRELLGTYAEPKAKTVAAMETTIIERELSIENAAQEVNLDKEWLAGGSQLNRRMDEVGLGSNDEWNAENQGSWDYPDGP